MSQEIGKTKEDLDLKELLKPYMKKWRWIALCAFLAVCLAIVYIKFSAPVYRTNATILIKDAKKMSNASGDFGVFQGLAGFSAMGTNSIENELEIFKSRKLVSDVVEELGLQTALYSPEKYYDVELYGETAPILVSVINEKYTEKPLKKPLKVEIRDNQVTLSSEELKKPMIVAFNKTVSLPSVNLMFRKNPIFNPLKAKKLKKLNDLKLVYRGLEQATVDYQKALEVDLTDKDATVVELGMEDANSDKSKDFLNAMVRHYNSDAISDKNAESKKTKDFIDERISIISKELGEVESQKERFKINNDLVDIGAEAKLNLELSAEARAKEVELETQLQLSNMLLGYLNKQGGDQALPSNVGLDNDAASRNIELYNTLVLRRNKLLENATEENPLVVELDGQIRQMRNSVREGLSKHISSLNMSRAKIGAERGSFNSKIGKIPTQEKLFRTIERQQQIKESLFLLLLQKREEAAISLAMTADKARIVDSAYSLIKPVSPKKTFTVFIAFLLGLLLPMIYIYFRELLNSRIITKHNIERISTVPVISEIPRMAKGVNPLIQMNDVSPMAEAFRILVTNLNFILPKKDKDKMILITSSTKGEGKTFISSNLALALASPKRKVLLVGCDIRNPQLQRYDKSMLKAEGLTEYLAESVNNARDIVHASPFSPYCDIIYSGSIPPNPTFLLENGYFGKLLDDIKGIYDYVILDSAPLMLVTDTFLISGYADATLYVTRSELTEKSFIDFANKNIEAKKLKNASFVLNDIHKTNFGYGNKYGYGYHAEKKKWWKFF